ncbi:AfsR/SARP family transcriptional regulator [Streptosporangium pseudovulgare]|uniref:SARP family transcriptional regulator n=1 Tax=Streptosporangium pseudovulgare TaxID=35765 RepID=A0ABQ2QTB1_9ACTN|nr:BTAD domain-containing putative transcriptional regulator [Streptosporangium pseudovulgare]GGP95377.1 SARP family transcriptional regulator [Streptosporangium pseudovulgare]
MSDLRKVRVLGPVDAMVDGTALEITGRRQRVVLALLALNAGRVVPLDLMIDAVWGERPPASARNQIAICVTRLRRVLHGSGEQLVAAVPPGYQLRPEAVTVDLNTAEELVRAGRAAAEGNDPATAAERLRSALELWRGETLSGLDSDIMSAEAARLEEWRLGVIEEYLDLRLAHGLGGEVITELTDLVGRHPFRERLRATLMRALCAAGRQAQAMEVYHRGRALLADELGVDPGHELRSTYDAILRGRLGTGPSSPPRPPAAGAVAQLPSNIAGFIGRERELDEMDRVFARCRTAGVPACIVITSMGGVGKTGLAVRWAHRMARHFPDGQLFIDLHGYTEQASPVPPEAALDRFLRALGVPGEEVPPDPDDRQALLRSLLAGRRVLFLLDNVHTSAQVRPLLPGTPGCAVVITTRDQLTDLVVRQGAHSLRLPTLNDEESAGLLDAIVGEDRMGGDRTATARIAELCGGLPLALRIAGARLLARPHWAPADLAARLDDEQRRLAEFNYGEVGLRANFSLSYQGLGRPAATLFRRLGLLDAPDFADWTAAALLGTGVAEAQAHLEELLDAQLVHTIGRDPAGQLRHRLHDLVRLYARERALAEEPEDRRREILARFLGCLLTLAYDANRRERGGDFAVVRGTTRAWSPPGGLTGDPLATPLDWLESERRTLSAGVAQAAGAGLDELAWELAQSGVVLYETRGYRDDRRAIYRLALDAARRGGNRLGEAVMLHGLGGLEPYRGQSSGMLDAALTIFDELGHAQGRALTLRDLGLVDHFAGRHRAALQRYQAALPELHRAGDRATEAHVLGCMAQIAVLHGDFTLADARLREALAICEEIGNQRGQAQALWRLGELHLRRREPARAAERFTAALAPVRHLRDRLGEAYILCGLGETLILQDRFDEALRTLTDARRLALDTGQSVVCAKTCYFLGRALAGNDEPEAARRMFQEAVDLSNGTAPLWEKRALAAMSDMPG